MIGEVREKKKNQKKKNQGACVRERLGVREKLGECFVLILS
jgi:hypothetical protein